MKISFSYPQVKARKLENLIEKKLREVIQKGVFLNGEENQRLVKNLSNYLESGYIVLTASGHDSLLFALQSLALNSNDEIIFPANVYPIAFPIAQSSGKMIPVDVDEYGLIDVQKLKKKITKKTRVIIVVHLYGLTAQVDIIKSMVKNKRIAVIEDCAQAFGSMLHKKPVGIFGDISCFSFYPTKNLGTLGDGGALCTKHKDLYLYFKKAVTYGEKEKYQSEFVSGHSRLPEIQAGVLNVYLQNFSKELAQRKRIFNIYQKLFGANNLFTNIRVLYKDKDSDPAMHLLVIEAKNRDKLRVYLSKKGIETHIHYPCPVHLVQAFSFLGFKKGSFPVAERLSENIISLPFHAYLKENQLIYVVQSLRNFYYD